MGIQFKNVKYNYKNMNHSYNALEKVFLSIKSKGEFIGICGETGSGKSTLVQLMNGLLEPTEGKSIIFNTEIPFKNKKMVNKIRQKVGLVFQFPEYQLFEETVLKDIMFGPTNLKINEKKAMDLAKKSAKAVGIGEKLLNKSPFKISGGEMRRVAIAGVLAMTPEILILDEPTRGLDPEGQNTLMKVINDIHLSENKTIIVISHDIDLLAKYAKRIIVMKNGKIGYDGRKEDLFENKEFINFSLEHPTSLKIMRFLNKKINTPFKAVYDIESLFNHLIEVSK